MSKISLKFQFINHHEIFTLEFNKTDTLLHAINTIADLMDVSAKYVLLYINITGVEIAVTKLVPLRDLSFGDKHSGLLLDIPIKVTILSEEIKGMKRKYIDLNIKLDIIPRRSAARIKMRSANIPPLSLHVYQNDTVNDIGLRLFYQNGISLSTPIKFYILDRNNYYSDSGQEIDNDMLLTDVVDVVYRPESRRSQYPVTIGFECKQLEFLFDNSISLPPINVYSGESGERDLSININNYDTVKKLKKKVASMLWRDISEINIKYLTLTGDRILDDTFMFNFLNINRRFIYTLNRIPYDPENCISRKDSEAIQKILRNISSFNVDKNTNDMVIIGLQKILYKII